MLAAIPYTTFPTIELGPLQLRTFGLVVGLGVLVGAWLAARYGEQFGIAREETYSLATRMVVGGVIGSRVTWVLSHWDELDGPLDALAIWKGGLQFSGGFIAAVIIGYPTYRHWARLKRWRSLDGYAYGLTIGLALGRVGCTAVGEHFGGLTSFPLAVRYEGGDVREDFLGSIRLQEGMVFHQTAIYELLYLVVLFAFLTWLLYLRPAKPRAGTAIGIFCAYYGVARFLSDSLRVNDERVLGLTGAQWMCVALMPTAAWILVRVRRQLDDDVAAEAAVATDPAAAPDEVEAPNGL